MKVTQEKLPASQIGLEIEVPPELSKQVYERVIQNFTRSANIPGFRKGKVPRQVLIQRFGATQLKAAAVEELIDDTLKQAIAQEKIDALGNYQLRSSFDELVQKFEPGQALVFNASVDVQPDVTLTQYSKLTVQAEEVKPDPERVDKTLQQYQEQSATLVPVEGRGAELKDVAVIDFKGVLPSEEPDQEPEAFPGGQAEDFQVELDEGKFVPGFVEGIIGMQIDETKEVALTFPDTYPQESLAGKDVIFTITLKELKTKELPELDDDFAQEISEFETLAELRGSLEKQYQEEADDRTKANKEQAILNELLQHIEVDVPETLIEREVNYMLNQTAMQLQNQGIDIRKLFNQDTIPALKERSRADALDRIKRTLALGEVAKQESIAVAPEDLAAKVEEVWGEIQSQDMAQTIDRNRLESVVAEDLLKEKILAWLIDNSTIELVPEGTLAQPEEPEFEEMDTDVTDDIAPIEAESASPTIDVDSVVVETEADEVAEAASAKAKASKSGKTTKGGAKAETSAATESEKPAAKSRKSTKSKPASEGDG